MDAFTQLDGLVAPMDRANVDTDQIIPKQYLKSIKRTGFGDYLFDAWRFLDQGTIGMTPNERQLNREFALNLPEYQGASILIARDNFGCGSSREHAVWALKEFGFFKGLYMSIKRILSCHPIKFLGGGEGFDPIKKKIKGE